MHYMGGGVTIVQVMSAGTLDMQLRVLHFSASSLLIALRWYSLAIGAAPLRLKLF